MNNLISIVVPTYNQGKYLRDSVLSILNNTYQDIEVIVVNDCSTDDTQSILRDMARHDARLKVINMNKNGGTAAALNIGFFNAKGAFSTWWASDNEMDCNCLKTLHDALVARPDIDFVYGNFDIEYVDQHITKNSKDVMDMQFSEEHLMREYTLGVCWLWRKELKDKAGYFAALDYKINGKKVGVEDYDMAVKMSKIGKFLYLEYTKSLGVYRHHGESQSAIINRHGAEKVQSKIVETIFNYRKKDVKVVRIKKCSGLARLYVSTITK